jgi:hypothetical protein
MTKISYKVQGNFLILRYFVKNFPAAVHSRTQSPSYARSTERDVRRALGTRMGSGAAGAAGYFPELINRWEICLRMRYILRGLRERDLGRVNTVI